MPRDFRAAFAAYKADERLSVKNNNCRVGIQAQQDKNGMIRKLMVAVSTPDDGQLIYVNIKARLTDK